MDSTAAHDVLRRLRLDGELQSIFSYSNSVFIAPTAVARFNKRVELGGLAHEYQVLNELPAQVPHAENNRIRQERVLRIDGAGTPPRS